MPAPLARYFTKKNVMNIIIAGVYHHLKGHCHLPQGPLLVAKPAFLVRKQLECVAGQEHKRCVPESENLSNDYCTAARTCAKRKFSLL